MVKKNTQEAPSAVERLQNEGRRNFLRAGGAVAAAAVLGTPTEADAQQKAFEEAMRLKELKERLKKGMDSAIPQPGQTPQPQLPSQRQPEINPNQNIAPMRYSGEGSVTGFNGQPVNLDTNDFKLKNAKDAYEEMSKLLGRNEDVVDFVKLYYLNQQATGVLAAKKAKFDASIEKINNLESSAYAETMGRVIRDIKALNYNDSRQAIVNEAVRAVFNVSPQAKNILVMFKQRPILGSGTQAKAVDLGVDAGNIVPTRTTIREYLKVHTVAMTFDQGQPADTGRTGYASLPDDIDRMFANNAKQRSAGNQIGG